MARPLPLVLACALAGCGGEPSPATPRPAPPPPTQAPAAATPGPELHAQMHQDLLRAAAIREAVIAGELDDTRAPARWLVEQSLPVPDDWRPHVAAMQAAAREVLDASDIKTAAAATGRLARQCGACHRSVGARHDMSFPPAPPPGTDPKHAMQLHQWAAERLYQGLISNNDDAWSAGASALANAPLHIEEITADVELPEELHGLAGAVHQLGTRAGAATDPDARAQLYGELVASCATCHKGGC